MTQNATCECMKCRLSADEYMALAADAIAFAKTLPDLSPPPCRRPHQVAERRALLRIFVASGLLCETAALACGYADHTATVAVATQTPTNLERRRMRALETAWQAYRATPKDKRPSQTQTGLGTKSVVMLACAFANTQNAASNGVALERNGIGNLRRKPQGMDIRRAMCIVFRESGISFPEVALAAGYLGHASAVKALQYRDALEASGVLADMQRRWSEWLAEHGALETAHA